MAKKKPPKFRNMVAVAAYMRTGAGKTKDRRTRRVRDRSAKNRWALKDQSE